MELPARAARMWRMALLVFFLALTTATHWPQLVLPEASPVTDKTAHLLVFLAAGLLLWRGRLFASMPAALLLTCAWGILDEWTQGIPRLHRHMTPGDGIANIVGACVAMAWASALQPIGSPGNRARTEYLSHSLDLVFLRPAAWIVLSTAGAILAGLVLYGLFYLEPQPARLFILAISLAWILGGWAVCRHSWNASTDEATTGRRCKACGSDAASPEAGQCKQCGTSCFPAQWDGRIIPSRLQQRRLMSATFIPVLLPGLSLAAILAWQYPALEQHGMGMSACMAVALGLSSVACGRYRRRLGLLYDQSMDCRGCGHNLRDMQGDRCPECDLAFQSVARTSAE